VRRVCPTVDASSRDWRADLESRPPHNLLVESSAAHDWGADDGDGEVGRVRQLLDWSEEHGGVATAFWETTPAPRITAPASLLERFRHLFVADPEAVAPLAEKLGGRRPMQLPLAAQVIPESVRGFTARDHPVAFFAARPDRVDGKRQRELEIVLDAAARHQLAILEREGKREEPLPDRLARFSTLAASNRAAIESLQNSRIAIGVDPRNEAALMVPQLVFDALAAGTVVLVPNYMRGVITLFRYTAVSTKTGDEAEEEIDRLLGDRAQWSEVSTVSRSAILNAHTYPHRIATIASAAGFRLVPEPERAYAFSQG
jgi:Glycosyl transferases group 1